MADDAPADDAPITFNIKSSSDAKYVLTLPLSTSVLDLKMKLSTSEYADLPPERQRLIYSGRVLKDADTLATYKIKDGHTVHLVKGAASNQRQNPTSSASSTATAGTGTQPGVAGVPTNIAAGTGNNPLAGLTGARYAGFAQLPGAGMFGPDGGMGPPPDPEQMITLLQNPSFASTLNEALQNPQILDQMIQGNPMLRNMGPQVRQMMQSPQFRQMMTDPEQIRQMARMQRMLGGGMGGGDTAFPAPGATDTTPGAEGQGNAAAVPPLAINPFAMLGNQAGAAGTGQPANAMANPFAAMLNPALFGNTTAAPATQTPGSTGQEGTAAGQATAGQQPSENPMANSFAVLAQNPALMQQMMGMMGGMGGTGTGAENPFAAMFGPGGFGAGTAAPQDTRPPEDRYAEQLRQLNDMGFYEFERNVEALRRTGGSVQGAVEYLLTH